MKNVLFFSLLLSAAAYGMNDGSANVLGLDKSLDEVEELCDISDAEISDIIYKEYDSCRSYEALCNVHTISANYFTSGPLAGEYFASLFRNTQIAPAIALNPVMYHRLEKLYKESNSSQAKQVMSTSSVDSEN